MCDQVSEAVEPDAVKEVCSCHNGVSLEILKQVHKMYEDRLDHIERVAGDNKLQLQVDTLRSWVGDLAGQNALLVQTVEDLELEATSRIMLERRKNQEIVCELETEAGSLRRRLQRKDSDLRGLLEVLRRLREFDICSINGIHFYEVSEADIFGSVEWRQKKLEEGDSRRVGVKHEPRKQRKHFDGKSEGSEKSGETRRINELQKENIIKEREIRKLNKDVLQYEQDIMNLKKEMSQINLCNSRSVATIDVEVMANVSCVCADSEARASSVHDLRLVNIVLSEETHALRRACAALNEQARAATQHAQFKDDIIREMRRQLKQAKAKLQDESSKRKQLKEMHCGDHECVRNASKSSLAKGRARRPQSRRGSHDAAPAGREVPLHPDSDSDARDPRLNGSGDDVQSN